MTTTRFQPGTSGNASGRPRDIFKANREALAQKLIQAALDGNLDCLQTAVAIAFSSSRQMKAGGGVKL